PAGLVYAAVGNLRAIDPPPAPRQAHALAGGQIGAMVDRLAMRLREAPNDAEGWTMLARSLAALGRYEESAKAFARLAELTPGNAGVLADYADTLAMARGRKLDGPPFALVKRALAIDPKHLKSLALAGSAEFERGNFQSAIRYWERILALVPAESGFAGSVQASIAQARQKLSGS
ncbi:MAG TPA: tetratricopeptide repeat protein, partial [Burkholderiales bacterium]